MRALLIGGLMLSTAILGAAQQTNRSAAAAEQPTAPPQPRPILNSASAAGFEAVVKPFLARNCFSCHGNEKHKHDLNFESFTSVTTSVEDRDRWDEVVLKLRHREMPPDEEPQPPDRYVRARAP